jgi:hypothetical protein
VSAWLYSHVLVVFGANFAQLEGTAHLAIKLVLLGGDFNVFLRRRLDCPRQVRIYVAPVRIEIAAGGGETKKFNIHMGRTFFSFFVFIGWEIADEASCSDMSPLPA